MNDATVLQRGAQGSFCRIFSVLFFALSISFQASAQSSQPQTISFQGFLSDSGGSALTDTLSIVFALYDSTDASVWTETHPTVGVIDGVFLVRLGSMTPFQLLWNQPYELGVAVAGDEVAYSDVAGCHTYTQHRKSNRPMSSIGVPAGII